MAESTASHARRHRSERALGPADHQRVRAPAPGGTGQADRHSHLAAPDAGHGRRLRLRPILRRALVTKVARTPPDPLLGSCLAIIDTSDLPARERAERSRKNSETWQAAGHDNPAEAKLIIDLVARYSATRLSWAVIVPYRAQAQYLRARLAELLGNETLVNDNVGTVDAFQGGERDVVIFGFTRSNPDGRIGFLSELRRLNVAITRARHQLILVGDFATLRAARDPGFADLAKALHAHALAHGEIHSSVTLRTRLRDHS